MRHLIVNGDDLGMCDRVNLAIFDLCDANILTSASLLVDGRAAQEAVLTIKEKYKDISLGLHLDFGKPPFKIDKLVRKMGRQWKKFYMLVGKGPTHVDVHNYPGISLQVSRFLPERVPIRNVGSINYIDKFRSVNGEAGVSLLNLIKILKRVKKGVYELACEPGYEPLGYEEEEKIENGCREKALRTLLDERVKFVLGIRKINLISYRDLLNSERFRIHILDRFYTRV
jgi:predicted glycoside hydrolase/deacetylase ChbG (UPF0249 family)